MIKYFLLGIILLSGCSSLKSDVGDYVTDAVVEKIQKEVESKLHGVTLQEIKSILDQNNQGKVDVFASAKDFAKDFTLVEAQKLVNSKMQELQAQVATKGDLDSKSKETWNYLVTAVCGIISAYLGKQIVSARTDHKRDLRITLLERAFGIDDPTASSSTQDAPATAAQPNSQT